MPKDIKIWRYHIPGENGKYFGWGTFLLDSTGMFCAVTDYGNYAFRWMSTGETDFRRFVVGLADSPDYLLSKVAGASGRRYDAEKTLNAVKREIIRCRKGGYSKEWAREEWDRLTDYADYENLETEVAFVRWVDQTQISDAWEMAEESWRPDCVAFATKLMPRLAETIKAELDKECEAA